MSLPGRRAQACCTRPHSLTPPSFQNSATKKREAQNVSQNVSQLDWNASQNKSNVANKLVAMENMYCQIIYFAWFHLYFTILYFCLQKAYLFFSILSFSFAKLYYLLQNCYVAYISGSLNYFMINLQTGISHSEYSFFDSCKISLK